MKCQILFSGKNKKNIINLPSAENAQRVVKVKTSFWQSQIFSFYGIQSNFNGSNIFGTIENCSRHGSFEPLRVNYGAKLGSKRR